MKSENSLEFWQRVACHIRLGRAAAWFLGLTVPIVMALSLFSQWHNDLVGVPQPRHLLLRAVVALLAFSVALAIFRWKIVNPAVASARKEIDDKGEES